MTKKAQEEKETFVAKRHAAMLNVRIRSEDRERLRAACTRRGLTMTEVILDGIDYMLEQMDEDPVTRWAAGNGR